MTTYKGDTPPRQRPGYYNVLKSFVLTLLFAFAADFVVMFMVGVVYAVQSPRHYARPPAELTYLVGLVVTPAALLYATYRRTGFDAARLGLNPIKNEWLLAVLSMLVVVHLPVLVWAFRHWAIRMPMLANARIIARGNLWTEVPMLVLTAAVVPVAEELLFRGWLWTDLRKHWRYPGTMLFTGLSFWLVHALEDWHKLIGVTTITIVLTVARRYCDSTRATLWLHIMNNTYAIGVLLVVFAMHR